MDANLKVTKITVEEMLARPEQSYNPPIWESKVLRYAESKDIQFYVTEKGNGYAYARFWCTYRTREGLYFFNTFTAFSASLTNHGFCKVFIGEDGVVEKFLFNNVKGEEGYAENCPANRKIFMKLGILVSNVI